MLPLSSLVSSQTPGLFIKIKGDKSMSKTSAVTRKKKLIEKFTTPQILKGGLYLTWGVSVLLLITIITGVQGQRNALKTVGKDSAPSILTAQQLKDSLIGMDAEAVNELLVKPGQNPDAIKGYQERYQTFSERIVAASENITYEPERKQIKIIVLALNDYITKIQRARDFHERGDRPNLLNSYREAREVMDQTLLPAADTLDEVNFKELDKTYISQKYETARALFSIILSGLLLLGVLVGLQMFIYYRMRRILNPMLLGASTIAVFFLGHAIGSLQRASDHLKVAKEDAFTSLHALRQTRALAYMANADESRYLLDKANAPQHEKAFFEKVAKIVTLPPNQTFESIISTLKTLKPGQTVSGFNGLMAVELTNITFPGEKEAALESLATFARYLEIDQQVRQLEKSGKYSDAIALNIGKEEQQSNWAFEQFKKANTKTREINEKAFYDSIKEGGEDLKDFEITTPVAMIAIGMLTLFGLLPRLKEYS
ncbi:MAG: hypothetical protein ACRCT1_14425 [Microcoleaceae cyanobacterium]